MLSPDELPQMYYEKENATNKHSGGLRLSRAPGTLSPMGLYMCITIKLSLGPISGGDSWLQPGQHPPYPLLNEHCDSHFANVECVRYI